MHTIVLRLDPARLDNPDLDLRYALPDLLAARSGGVIADDGYDYAGGPPPFLVLYLKAAELDPAVACVRDVVENVRVLNNDLRQGVAVAVRRGDGHDVVYPPGFVGPFLPA
jgi:hypothetical protein